MDGWPSDALAGCERDWAIVGVRESAAGWEALADAPKRLFCCKISFVVHRKVNYMRTSRPVLRAAGVGESGSAFALDGPGRRCVLCGGVGRDEDGGREPSTARQ